MCGIAGILSEDGRRPDLSDLQSLAKALAHRGPDGEGIWTSADGRAAFVHRRLAILDITERGAQPMHSADGRYTIVYNGEIFNFLELRAELELLGSRFRTDTDTEVILEAWRYWGPGMLQKFNGMWALALRDNISGEVFFARDRFGIKPLLYTYSKRRLAFASEMRAFRELPWIDRAIDLEVASRTLVEPFSIEGSAKTTVGSVCRLPPGHCAWWHSGALTVERWWRTVDHLVPVPTTAAEQAEQFRELFLDAIRLRMRSDVTLGTCLSGGFDSSAIVCGMSEVAKHSQVHVREAEDWRHAYIASFPGRSNDETPLALEAAGWAGVTPHVLDLSEVDDEGVITSVLNDLDEIHIGLPAAPWQIYREVRARGTLVTLDGHGADELMGGYLQSGGSLSLHLRNLVAASSLHSPHIGELFDRAKLGWLRARGLAFLRKSPGARPPPPELAPDVDLLPDSWGPMNRRLYRLFHCTVLPTILRNFDRLSMAHGVEVRMPFMDWRLVTYVMSLPDRAKLADGLSKVVARNGMRSHMPDSIRRSARKVGFNSPMPEWLNGELGAWTERVLHAAHETFDEIVDSAALRARVSELNNRKGWNWDNCGRLWPYISLKWQLTRGTR